MALSHKDINLLTQKATIAGTEKIPVSDTEFVTTTQIATSKQVHLSSESEMPASPDASTLYLIDGSGGGGSSNIVHLDDESEMPVSPDADTLYVIDESGSSTAETTANKVTSLSSSSTDTQYPSAKCVYDLVGDVETLLNALL